jgi:hypothetical protein
MCRCGCFEGLQLFSVRPAAHSPQKITDGCHGCPASLVSTCSLDLVLSMVNTSGGTQLRVHTNRPKRPTSMSTNITELNTEGLQTIWAEASSQVAPQFWVTQHPLVRSSNSWIEFLRQTSSGTFIPAHPTDLPIISLNCPGSARGFCRSVRSANQKPPSSARGSLAIHVK